MTYRVFSRKSFSQPIQYSTFLPTLDALITCPRRSFPGHAVVADIRCNELPNLIFFFSLVIYKSRVSSLGLQERLAMIRQQRAEAAKKREEEKDQLDVQVYVGKGIMNLIRM
ncbi:hypothetical protein V6N11_082758 [Hibiscus sabdariffa]|uniref:Uncharacterized protein n=1 Tax=Hibiscus sabdariffa TaxID=183260 RepID=A0ABR2QJV0_9ROSI